MDALYLLESMRIELRDIVYKGDVVRHWIYKDVARKTKLLRRYAADLGLSMPLYDQYERELLWSVAVLSGMHQGSKYSVKAHLSWAMQAIAKMQSDTFFGAKPQHVASVKQEALATC